MRTIRRRRHPTGRNDACDRRVIYARPFPPSSHREPVPTGRRRFIFKTGLEGEHPASSGTPRALETIGIHLKIPLGLSNEVGPPHT